MERYRDRGWLLFWQGSMLVLNLCLATRHAGCCQRHVTRCLFLVGHMYASKHAQIMDLLCSHCRLQTWVGTWDSHYQAAL